MRKIVLHIFLQKQKIYAIMKQAIQEIMQNPLYMGFKKRQQLV